MSNNPSKIKQVIVVRKDLNMRKGKMCAQSSHASMSFLTKKAKITNNKSTVVLDNPDIVEQWFHEGFTKICVSVDSETELDEIYMGAMAAGLTVHMITDSGHTEFNGVPTKTCLCIGPNKSEDIDVITSHLKLL
ncbi:MAG: aminoacyl-tRNA hydrolase [Bacteroidia bacterium]